VLVEDLLPGLVVEQQMHSGRSFAVPALVAPDSDDWLQGQACWAAG
jgi:hypothetical protein